ncbi:glycosyltransferase family 4 protein [Aeoliella sp.]|uniref:glycosyltransferase family 4 protein n=1 Tax=Aeoliella sp. TaxID=2795800 RepID=UPI003CCBD096
MRHTLRLTWVLSAANLSGGTKSNRLIAEAMVRRGHQVNIAYSTFRKWPAPWRFRRFTKRCFNEVRNRIDGPCHHLQSSSAKLVPIRERPISAHQVPDADFVFATWWETREWIESWPARKGEKLYFVRHHELHGGDPERVRATYRLPGQKFVIARWLQRLMAEEYGDSTSIVIPNGVDRGQFHAPPRGKQPVPTVGFMYAKGWKGGDTAMRALEKVKRQVPQLRVIVMTRSKSDRNKKFPSFCEVHFQPSQSTIPLLYSQTDCWLLPSTSEGFGMPGIEAAACRCPVVATRCGGPEDYVIDGETGYLVPVDDSEEMANAILRALALSDREWKAMSDASQNLALKFDWDHSAELLEAALFSRLETSSANSTSSMPLP